MTQAEMIAAAQAAADMIDMSACELTLADRALIANLSQDAAMRKAAKSGSEFAAYWAGSASASLQHHYRAGAYRTVRA